MKIMVTVNGLKDNVPSRNCESCYYKKSGDKDYCFSWHPEGVIICEHIPKIIRRDSHRTKEEWLEEKRRAFG